MCNTILMFHKSFPFSWSLLSLVIYLVLFRFVETHLFSLISKDIHPVKSGISCAVMCDQKRAAVRHYKERTGP